MLIRQVTAYFAIFYSLLKRLPSRSNLTGLKIPLTVDRVRLRLK